MTLDPTAQRAYRLYLKGYSLRNIEKAIGIPRSTLSYKFRKIFGPNYAQKRNKNGTIQILQEYLKDPSISQKHKREIKEFIERKLTLISEMDSLYQNQPLYTNKKIQSLTNAECSRGKHPYDFQFERFNNFTKL